MKISPEKKREILLETFETLKKNYNDNSSSLAKLIGKMSKVDLEISIEMWKYLIKNNPDVLHSTDDFSFSVMYDIEQSIGEAKTYSLVARDSFLKNAIYHESGDLSCTPTYAIQYFVAKNELAVANDLMELIFTNKYKENSLYEILDDVIPEDEEISEEAFNLLSEWISKVKNKEERAKLNLKMLSFMDEEDD